MESTYYQPPKPSSIMKFFWRISGADKYILERSTYGDQIKYLCLGGIILATGVMAGLAGGYAFYTIFEPKGSALDNINTVVKNVDYQHTDIPTAIMSVIFGVVWGYIIFNIDRFIVTSTGKGDGTEAITRQELIGALPRIIMGIIIAITISKPVEIRMFKSEIDVELYSKQLEEMKRHKAQIDLQYDGFILAEQQKIDQLRQEIKEKYKQRDDLSVDLDREIQGRIGSGKIGDGPAAASIRGNMERIANELSILESRDTMEISKHREIQDEWKKKKETELGKSNQVAAGLDGLLERIKLSQSIAGFWISLFITLLFVAIELTPVFFKLMLIKGPYDFLEDNIKEMMKAENGIHVIFDYYKDKQGQERDLITYLQADQIIKKQENLFKAQQELSEYAIQKWKEEQKRKIDTNLSDYIIEEPI